MIAEAAAAAYHPFFEVLRSEPDVALTVHCSGSLLGWLREHAGKTFDLLGELAASGRVELLTGGFYEPILPMLREADKVGQIQRLTEFLRTSFGVTPRGMWLAERVWEPQLPRALAAAGVEYVVVDDHHFALAGLDPESLGGYFLTEDEGQPLAVFPISERLRYLVPFAEPRASLRVPGVAARGGQRHPGGRRREVRCLAGHPPARVHGGLAAPVLRHAPERALAGGVHLLAGAGQPAAARAAYTFPPRPTRRWASGRCPRRRRRRSRRRGLGSGIFPTARAWAASCAAASGGASS